MSVSRMKKLTVFAHKDEADELVKRLIRLRCVDIGTVENSFNGAFAMTRCNGDAARSALESSVADINEAMALLNRYSKKKRSLLRPKTRVNWEDFLSNGSADSARQTVKQALRITERQTEIKNEISKIQAACLAAKPYVAHDLPLGMTETEQTDLLLGVLPAAVDF